MAASYVWRRWLYRRPLVADGGLVHECLKSRPNGNQDADLPVILLAGPRGSGKTELLREIQSRCRLVPNAWVDFGNDRAETTRDVLISLRRQLGVRRRQYGRIAFPRLAAALLVDGNPLDDDVDNARGQIRRRLDEYFLASAVRPPEGVPDQESVLEFEVDTSGHVRFRLSFSFLWQAGNLLLTLARLLWALPRRRRRLAAVKTWYRNVDGGDYLDALVDLKHTGAGEMERTLCEAFLADLQAAFSDERWASHRTLNAIALFDDVHSEWGHRFLGLLVGARRRRHGAEGSLPLAIVATSGQASDDDLTPEAETTTLTLADWARRQTAWAEERSSRFGIRLRGLTPDEVADVVAAGAGDVPHLSELVHRLTAGHPWMVALLVDAVRERRLAGGEPLDLRQLLDLPAPKAYGAADRHAASEDTVAHRALDHLLRGVDAVRRELLIRWSPAADVGQIVRMARLSGTAPPDPLLEDVTLRSWMQAGVNPGLHPLLRRLLLRELARDRAAWDDASERLRADYELRLEALEGRPDLDDERRRELDDLSDRVCYHELALGRLGPVVKHLKALLLTADVGPWLGRFKAIASAPCLPYAGGPEDRVATLVKDTIDAGDVERDDIDEVLCLLVACRWVIEDPLGDPELTLAPRIRRQFERLADLAVARLTRPAFVALYRQADSWQHVLDPGARA